MSSPSTPSTELSDAGLCGRCVVLCLGVTTAFSLLGWRLVNLHLFQADTFRQAAEEPWIRGLTLPASRGAILDAHGEILAIDHPSYTVVIDRHLLRDLNLAMRTLATKMGIKPSAVARHFTEDEMRDASIVRTVELIAPRLKRTPAALRREVGDAPRGEVIVAKDIGDEEAQQLKEFIEAESIPGVIVRKSWKRTYQYPELAVHVVGFANNDGVGVDGVEKSMDAVLTGHPGTQWFERDRRGNEIRSTTLASVDPRRGRDVRLTLDHEIQEIVEQELDATGSHPDEVYVPPLKADRVTVILIDPATCSVVALANRPHHSLVTRDPLTPNLAVSETYEPGSTFKINAYVGVLDRRLVGLATPLNLHGGHYDKGFIHIEDSHKLASGTVLTAFTHSSNIGAYLLASQLGAQSFHEYVRKMGFGSRTGIDLPNEAPGSVKPVEQWGALSLRSMSFGYEVNVTPVQVITAYMALLNDGILRRPRLIEAVLNEDGTVVDERVPDEGRRVCSSTVARQLREGMIEVVKKGTGTKGAIPGYQVGGKTGTSLKYDPRIKGYVPGGFVLSFVGFVQSSRGAELAGIVVVDYPKVEEARCFGGAIAGPIFRRIVSRVLTHRGIAPDPELMPKGVAVAADH